MSMNSAFSKLPFEARLAIVECLISTAYDRHQAASKAAALGYPQITPDQARGVADKVRAVVMGRPCKDADIHLLTKTALKNLTGG
jgi:hypothetical protein